MKKTHLPPRFVRPCAVLLILERRVDIIVILVAVDPLKLVPSTKNDIFDIPLAQLALIDLLVLISLVAATLVVILIRRFALDVPPPLLDLLLLGRRRGGCAHAVLSQVDLGHDEVETAVEGEEGLLEREALGEGGVEGREAVDEGGDLRRGRMVSSASERREQEVNAR